MSVRDDSTATWTTPDRPGSYKITFAATDPKGLKTEKILEVKVLPARQMYSGSLNEPGGEQRRHRGKVQAPALQPKKSGKGPRAPKTK
jgi:hypothetical protein